MRLSDIEMFKSLSAIEQSRLFGSMDRLEISAGGLVFEQEDAGDSMYVIDEGGIELFTVDEEGIRNTLAALNPGDVFGEMSLLTETNRTASAVAICRSTLYRISAETFKQLLKENNAVANYFLRLLSERLKQTDITLQKAESSKQRLIQDDLDKMDDTARRVILSASMLPVCHADFLSGYLGLDADGTFWEEYARLYPHIISWDVQTESIVIQHTVLKQLRAMYLARFEEPAVISLVSAAARYYIAREMPEKAVQVYAENQLWTQACDAAAGLLVSINENNALRDAVMEQLLHCPDALLFQRYELFTAFLKVYLERSPASGFRKLEAALAGGHDHISKEQEISLYQMAAEYCQKLGQEHKSLEYVNMALTIAASLSKSGAGDGITEDIDQARNYQLSKRQLKSAMGMSLAMQKSRSFFERSRLLSVGVALSAVAVIALFSVLDPFAGLSGEAMVFIGISLAAVILWIVDVIPSYIVALLMLSLWVLMGLVKPAVALSGFSSPTWMYMLCTLALGAAIAKSGLLYRMSLYVLKAFPKNQHGQLLGFAISGIVLNPLIPSSTAKVSLSAPIAQGVAEAMGFPSRSNGAAGLGLGAMVFYGFFTPFFLTGSSFNVMVLGLMPGKPNISWIEWFVYALPTLFFFAVGIFFVISYLFKPEKVSKKLSDDVLNEQLRILGEVSRGEWITIVVTVTVVVMLVTQSLHAIDSAWVLLLGFCCLAIGGILDSSTLKSSVDWPFLLFTGVFFSFANVLEVMGIVNPLTQLLGVVMGPFMSTPYLFLPAATVFTFFLASTIREDATAILLTVAMCPIAQGIGIHPWVLVMVILLASDPFFYASQSTTYLTAYYSAEEKSFSHQQGQKLSFYYGAMVVVAIVLSIPFWQMMGLIR